MVQEVHVRESEQDGTALRYAGEFMRQDRQFVLEALSLVLGIFAGVQT